MPWVATLRKAETPRFTDTVAQSTAWRALHAAADASYPDIRTLFESAFGAAQQALPFTALREAMARGDEGQAIALVSQAWTEIGEAQIRAALPGIIAQTVTAGATASLLHAEALFTMGRSIVFNTANPRTLAYIDEYAGARIRQVSIETLAAVRTAVRRGVSEGRGVAAVARELRQSVGLTERQAVTVANYRAGLLEARTPAKQLATLVERRQHQLIRQRAVNIARTESITSASAGQHQLLLQLRDDGVLDEAQYRRFWIRTPGERTCPQCNAIPRLNQDGVTLTQPFQTPIGPVMYPALHPSCRCAVALRSIA